VLLPANDEAADSPVGYVSGAIDLLVRDPEEPSAFRVIDYKTDILASAVEREARARAYAAQGQIYAEAVRGALDLPVLPRFELWFLASGEVIELASA
jgi:ATP-dependent exoDNAse (exonuclease V) beta subunit